MSLFRMMLREILCDEPGCNEDDGTGGGDSSARELRQILKGRGWTHHQGKDFCPKHSRPS